MKSFRESFSKLIKKPRYFMCIAAVLITLSCYILITFSMMIYSNCLQSEIEKRSFTAVRNINDRVDGCMDSLAILGSVYINHDGKINTQRIDNISNVSEAFLKKNMFCQIFMCDLKGNAYFGKESRNISKKTFFENAVNGTKYIEFNDSFLDYNSVFVVSVPIYYGNQIIGVACGLMTPKSFFGMTQSFDDKDLSAVYVIDEKGNVVSQNNRNFLKSVSDNNSHIKGEINNIKEKLSKNENVYMSYKMDNIEKSAYIVPLIHTDWSVVNICTNKALSKSFFALLLSITIISIIIVIMIVFMFVRKLFKANSASVKLEASQEMNSIVFSDIMSIIFEYSFIDKTVMFSEYGCKQFDLEQNKLPLSLFMDNKKLICEESRKQLEDFFLRINKGVRYNQALCKLRSSGQPEYSLYRINTVTIYDNDGSPYKVVGFVNNVSSDEFADEIVVHDSLTGLFNKVALTNMFMDYVKYNNDEKGAMIIFDLKNFRLINDRLGYKAGDRVIMDISEKLRQLFRSSDIIARTGDDEFTVFMKNVSDHDLIEKRVLAILIAADNIIPKEKKIKACGNIGIAVYPDNGKDFDALYNNAVCALKEARKAPALSYTYYNEDIKK